MDGAGDSSPVAETLVDLRCDLCGGNCNKHFASKYDLEYRQCNNCDFVFADVRAFDFEAFNSESMEGLRDTHLNKHTSSRYLKQYAKLLKQFEPYRQTNRFLEVGSSTGGFLSQVKAAGWKEYGVEPDPGSGTYSRDELGLNVHLGTLDSAQYEDNSFDVIYSNAVIEHVETPSEVIADAYRVLRPGGVFYADTVNLDSYTWKFLGTRWKLFDPRMHLSLFTPQTLSRHCEQVGLSVSKIATHGVRFHATRADQPRGWRRLVDELRKTPYSFAARRTHKGDNIAIYAEKPL
jgi:SAM-dependent methyltransferase